MTWNRLIFFGRFLILIAVVEGCGIYSFTGASIPPGVTTFQVNFFENQAGNRPGSTVEPGLDNDFTNALQDLIMNQTNLNLVSQDGQLIYEGEITEYSVTPMSATAKITAAQNRLKMAVTLRFYNIKKKKITSIKVIRFFTTSQQNYRYMMLLMLPIRKFLIGLLRIFLMTPLRNGSR